VKNGVGANHIYSGSLTSSESYLTINSSASTSWLTIYSAIVDNSSHRVGLKIQGRWSNTVKVSEVWLHNFSGNTYTGDTIVERGGSVILCNLNARPSIQSRNLFVNNGTVFTYRSNQLRDDAFVYLSNAGQFNLGIDSATQKLRSLNVNGRGVLGFGVSSNVSEGTAISGYRNLFLDDLNIEWGSELLIKNWQAGVHRLFVRKGSKHLWESLGRIKYEGKPLGWHGEARDYDKDYWEVFEKTPEPGVYGAVFGALGLVSAAFRKTKGDKMRVILPCKFGIKFRICKDD